jgi:hypothetical protein
MLDNTNNDRLLSQLMQKSLLEMPFTDFEETVMHRIQSEVKQKSLLLRYRKLSFVFFVLGTGFGLAINFILQKSQLTFPGISPQTTLLIFQSLFVLLFLTQLDNSIQLFRSIKKNSYFRNL